MGDDEDIVEAAFRRFDQNENGLITQQEMGGLLKELDPSAWDDDKVDQLYRRLNTSGAGVNINDFAKWVKSSGAKCTSADELTTSLNEQGQVSVGDVQYCPKRLILVRHGESEGNVDHKIYEHVADNELHLTDTGWDQAYCAGRELKNIIGDDPVQFKVSPYVRTRETFNAVVDPWGGPKNVSWNEDPRIREQDFGNFQNVAQTQQAKRDRDRFGAFYYRMPDGESPADVYDRLSSFFESMYREWDNHRCDRNLDKLNYVIVCHGITVAVFLMRMFKYSVDDYHQFKNSKNAEMIILERRSNGKYSLNEVHCVWPEKVIALDGSWDGLSWQPKRGPRDKWEDAGRYDRKINTMPPRKLLELPDLTREVTAADEYNTMEFNCQQQFGFRCNEEGRVESIICDSQADAHNVNPGWYLHEVNGKQMQTGQVKEMIRSGKLSGETCTVRFRIPCIQE